MNYEKFTLPRNSKNYEVSLSCMLESVQIPGIDLGKYFAGIEKETSIANSEKNAISDVLRRRGIHGYKLDTVLEHIEKAGTRNFARIIGDNPPQVKKMIKTGL